MKRGALRRPLLALALGLLVAPASAAEEESGKRIDNARVDMHALPAPGEIQPATAFPLSSGVSAANPGASS